MKPLKSELEDPETLRELGSASVQIVHDLKNQLNGLKLYATFLRKRLEKSDRPADELETVAKLIAGLERAATEMNVLVRLGRPLELRRQPRTDLARLLATAAEDADAAVRAAAGSYEGDFDPTFLGDALKSITAGSRGAATGSAAAGAPEINLRRDETGTAPAAVIEWRAAEAGGGGGGGEDVFRSFAGGQGLRMALAAKVIRAHGGEVAQEASTLRARLPLSR
jgi:signal transduction histidine kinase